MGGGKGLLCAVLPLLLRKSFSGFFLVQTGGFLVSHPELNSLFLLWFGERATPACESLSSKPGSGSSLM